MLNAGIHMIGAKEYHADPCPDPSLSSSIARILLAQSPRHAWMAHPRLNPAYVPEEKDAFDLGTVAHALILEGDESNFTVVDAKDWKSSAAQAAKASARAEGKTPILAHQLVNARAMASAVGDQLDAHEAAVYLDETKAEETLLWEEDGIWCRARLDLLSHDRRHIFDLKSTSGSARPDTWERSLFAFGYDVQAGFYLRGVRRLFNLEATFRFIVAETQPPYAVSVIALDEEALDLADRKVSRAINLWRACLKRDQWPGYALHTMTASAPPWELARFESAAEPALTAWPVGS